MKYLYISSLGPSVTDLLHFSRQTVIACPVWSMEIVPDSGVEGGQCMDTGDTNPTVYINFMGLILSWKHRGGNTNQIVFPRRERQY